MIGLDTNLLLYARVAGSAFHDRAASFLASISEDPDVVISELVLVELYVLLRNPSVLSSPLTAAEAVSEIQNFRRHPRWQLADATSMMDKVWPLAAKKDFPRRRIFDVRLALMLQASGVDRFATANPKDFQGLGFKRVWNPLNPEN